MADRPRICGRRPGWRRTATRAATRARRRCAALIAWGLRRDLRIGLSAWTDYPIAALGDAPGVEAPVRRCVALGWDGDKYAFVRVEGVVESMKTWFVYAAPGRVDEARVVDRRSLPVLTWAEMDTARRALRG